MRSVERTYDSPSSASAKLLPVALLILLVAGCATVPDREPEELASLIPEEHSGFLSIAPGEERFLSQTLLGAFGVNESDAQRIVSRSERAYLGFGPGGRFTIVASGRYPDGAIRRNLRREGWETTAASVGEESWVHPLFAYRIIRLRRDQYLLTTEERLIGSGFSLAEAAGQGFLENTGVFFAPDRGGRVRARWGGGARLPISGVVVEWRPEVAKGGEVVATVTVASQEEARTLLVLTRLLVVGVLNAAGIGFQEIPDTLTVEREGNTIMIMGL